MEDKLSPAQKDVILIQNDLSKNKSENLSLKFKIAELEQELASTVSELKNLKSETISKSVIGENVKKNMQSKEKSFISNFSRDETLSQSNNISADRNLSQYFIYKKI